MQVDELNSGSQLVQLSKLSQSQKISIPDTWKVKRLKDLAEINPETIHEDYKYRKILYIDIGSIQDYEIQKYEQLDLDKRPSRAQRIARKNDIIVSTVRPYLKAFTKISDSSTNLICSTGFAVLRPKNADDVDYLFSYIKSHHFEANIIRHMEGMAYPAVTSEIVENCLIPYPTNKNETLKIGSTFSTLDNLIQKTDQIIEQTQRLKKGLMQTLLTKGIGQTKFKKTSIGQIPEEWAVKMLSDISELIMGTIAAR